MLKGHAFKTSTLQVDMHPPAGVVAAFDPDALLVFPKSVALPGLPVLESLERRHGFSGIGTNWNVQRQNFVLPVSRA
jgi:hypothetical protein